MRAGDDEGVMAGFRALCNQSRGGWQGRLKRNWWECMLSVSGQRIQIEEISFWEERITTDNNTTTKILVSLLV